MLRFSSRRRTRVDDFVPSPEVDLGVLMEELYMVHAAGVLVDDIGYELHDVE